MPHPPTDIKSLNAHDASVYSLGGNHVIKAAKGYCKTRYGNTHYWGSPSFDNNLTPLLCLHMSAHSGRAFEPIISIQSNKRRIIAIDYPGYGNSDIPVNGMQLNIDDYAAVAWEVLEQLSIDKVHVFGHHTGSKVAVALAAQKPSQIVKVILAASSITPPNPNLPVAQITPLDDDGTRYTKLWQQFRSICPPNIPIRVIANMFVEAIKAGDNYMSAQFAAQRYNGVFAEMLQKLNHPITVLNLADDLKSETPKVMQYINNGKMIECPEWGYGFLETHADDVLKQIEFIIANDL